jgi:hypothetical protein
MSDLEREFADKKEAERIDNEKWQVERKKVTVHSLSFPFFHYFTKDH